MPDVKLNKMAVRSVIEGESTFFSFQTGTHHSLIKALFAHQEG